MTPVLHVVELTSQPTVAVRIRVPMSEVDMGALFEKHLPRIFGEFGSIASGPPYGRYHEWGEDIVDVEIGLPVSNHPSAVQPLDTVAEGEMGASSLPGGTAATTTHLGSYETLGETYDRLREWIVAQDRTGGPGPWESYVDDPGQVKNISRLKTEVYWPLT